VLHRLTRIVVAGNAATSAVRPKAPAAPKPVAAAKPVAAGKAVSAGKPAAETPRGAQAVAAAAQAFAERLRVKVHGIAA
jgi:hypothetical protein